MFRTKYYREEEEVEKAPIHFHSKVGQKRLVKIWTHLRLSDESLFSSWGSSESALTEKVNEYIQQYLHLRLQRFSGRQGLRYVYQQRDSTLENEEIKRFCHYYQCKRKEELNLNERMKARVALEEFRFTNMQNNHEMSNVQAKMPQQNMYFSGMTCSCDSYGPKLNRPTLSSQSDNPSPGLLQFPTITSNYFSTATSNISRSSGFDEPTPSPDRICDSNQSSLIPSNTLFSDSDDTDYAQENLDVMNEQKRGWGATETLDAEIVSLLVLALANEIKVNQMSPLLENLYEEQDLRQMFEMGDRIRQMYKRETQAANTFSAELSQFMISRIK